MTKTFSLHTTNYGKNFRVDVYEKKLLCLSYHTNGTNNSDYVRRDIPIDEFTKVFPDAAALLLNKEHEDLSKKQISDLYFIIENAMYNSHPWNA